MDLHRCFKFTPTPLLNKIELKNWVDSLSSLHFPNLQKAPKRNLSKLEWVAINDEKNDKNIEIKEADKGGSVVVVSKFHYKSMLLSQLNDEKTHKKIKFKSRSRNRK